MIRHAHGNEFLLIAQHEHALFSGRIARRWGNDRFAIPTPFGPVMDGVALHDAGWPLHDDEPTLNAAGLPLHVLETPAGVATRVWGESVRRAAEVDAYAGLLVSLHVQRLSALAQSRAFQRPRQEVFALNQFHHRQIEVQEALRQRLGLRTDRPLHLGLAAPGTGPEEDLLLANYHLLKALDRVSLDVCSGESLFQTIDEVFPRPGAASLRFTIEHPAEFVLSIDPWPFEVDRFDEPVPCRRVPAREYSDVEGFRQIYAGAPGEVVEHRVVRRGVQA